MTTIQTLRWTRQEYEHLFDSGVLSADRKVELLDGEIFEMTPQKSRHATAVGLTASVLGKIFEGDFHVRTQLPLALDAYSEPEPDVWVVAGGWRDYRDDHPSSSVLVVEVAETSLSFDRKRKASAYARAGILDYWIVNLEENCLEVYRDPVQDPSAASGWRYSSVVRLGSEDGVSPLAAPNSAITVESLLP